MRRPRDNEDDPVIGRKKSRRRTWLGARHLALNAEGQLQLQQLNAQYDTILTSQNILSSQFSFFAMMMMFLSRMRGVSLTTLFENSRVYKMMFALLASKSVNLRQQLFQTQRVIDNLTIIRQSDYVTDSVPPKIRRTIDSLSSDTEAELYTRFTRNELHELFNYLRFPPGKVRVAGHVFTTEEIFIFSLTFLSKGETFISMKDNFGGDSNAYGYMVYWFIDHIFSTFYHKISGDSLRMWMKDVDIFRKKIWEDVCFVKDKNGSPTDEKILNIPFEDWRAWSFIDCTYMRSNRPGQGPINEEGDWRDNAQEIQQAFYSTYLKACGLKFQCITLPNGIFGSVWGAALSHNDRGMVNMSGLEDYLVSDGMLEMNIGSEEGGFYYPAIYGDSIYVPSDVIQKAVDLEELDDDFEDEDARSLRSFYKTLNRHLNRSRTCIENHFALVFGEYAVMKRKERHKLWKNKERVYKLGIVCFFLTNCYTCIRNNAIGKRFGMNRVTLEEYIPLDEDIEPFEEEVDVENEVFL